MTIRLKITNEDTNSTRGVRIYRYSQPVATLLMGQSCEQHVWHEGSITIEEFYLDEEPSSQ